jgi:hypothetical protein
LDQDKWADCRVKEFRNTDERLRFLKEVETKMKAMNYLMQKDESLSSKHSTLNAKILFSLKIYRRRYRDLARMSRDEALNPSNDVTNAEDDPEYWRSPVPKNMKQVSVAYPDPTNEEPLDMDIFCVIVPKQCITPCHFRWLMYNNFIKLVEKDFCQDNRDRSKTATVSQMKNVQLNQTSSFR